VEGTLRQAHKMDAIGQLTGGIAHDFNNLLTGIIGSIDLLRKRVSQGRIGELDRYFDAALASANRAAALTHRLLAFSRRQPLAPCATDVNRLVVGMEDLFRRTVGPAIHIDTRLSAALWLTKCDPNQLENALLNLVINARDAMPDGGRVTIATANVSAPADATNEGPVGDLVTVTVTDSGAGMTPEVMARAFEPFFTTKPVGQGTGLGLAMIYGFAQQSGGHVDLRSKPGQGLAVVVSLPRTFAKAGTAPVVAAARGLSLARAGATVLVVEDEPSVRLVICDALAEQGYAVREAADGRTALRHLESGVVTDLLVTDLGLPGGFSGWDLAEAARPGRPDLKVLFITGLAVKEGTGADVMVHAQVLRKPFTTDTLLARVHDLLGGDAAVPSTPALNRGMRPTPPLDRGAD
jgi:CheY-like chemotaxis protein